MIQHAENLIARPPHLLVGRPPLPREHGGWVMLTLPLVVGFCAAGGGYALQWMWLLVAVTGLFLAREAAGLLLRKRGRQGTAFWLFVYLVFTAVGAIPLFTGPAGASLIAIGGIGALVMGLHSALLIIPARKRLDRTVYGEILGACGLSLTGPAAWVAARGSLDPAAWAVWGLCALYFGGSILTVKMRLESVKYKKVWSDDLRTEIGRGTLLFHSSLAAGLLFFAGSQGGNGSALLVLAFLPALARAFRVWSNLSPTLPNLKMVGLFESGIAVWFGVFLVAALRAGL